ncbi:MAG: PHB depolymerase family esterase, partial [Acidimicrobiaceae bacterium]
MAFTVVVPDVVPPTVSVTQPVADAVLTGSVTVSADASDDVGVAGVQLLLDGAALGTELLAPPYTLLWSTGSTANGPHTLAARARDAGGNTTTSLAVAVTVSNTAPPPPTGLVAAYGFDELSGTTAADASGNGNV